MRILEVWDYVSMISIVTLTCAVGLFSVFRTRKTTQADAFLVANKELNVFSLVMSIVATVISAGQISGFPMECYSYGLVMSWISLSHILSPVLAAILFLPVFYELNTRTIFEYLELRFNPKMRVAISVAQSVRMLFFSSFFLYATALVLNQVTDVNVWISVIAIGVICIVYTALGGFKAVVWTDVAQQIIVYAILVLLVIKGLIDLGGPSVVWDRVEVSGRNNILTWAPSSDSLYSMWTFIPNTFSLLSMYAVNQPLIQRSLSGKNLKKAKMCLMYGGLGLFLCFILIYTCGALLIARYYNCDPKMMGHVRTRDQMVTLFATETLSFCNGLSGVFIAGLICATISALSSNLNSLAAVTLSDYIRPFYPDLKQTTTLTLSKLITAFHGLLSIGLVAVIQQLGGFLKIAFTINGLIGGPTVVIFTVGMALPWVTTKAAIIGTVASMVLPWWVTIGQMATSTSLPYLPFSVSACANHTDVIYNVTQTSFQQQFYSISPIWFTLWGLAVGLPVSLLAGKVIGFQDASKVDQALLFPFIRKFVRPSKAIDETQYELCGKEIN